MGLPILIKVQGKCTTDHISAEGSWLQYRGHLESISRNCLIVAIDSANGEANIQNTQTGERGPVPKITVQYRDRTSHGSLVRYLGPITFPPPTHTLVAGDHKNGEGGSSREHAAFQPCLLAFARIHETNLKFSRSRDDYGTVQPEDKGLESFARGKNCQAKRWRVAFELAHSINGGQIAWFRAGSALNLMAENAKKS